MIVKRFRTDESRIEVKKAISGQQNLDGVEKIIKEEKIEFQKRYSEDVKEILNSLTILKSCYFDGITQKKLAEELGIVQSVVNKRFKMEKEALKVLLMDKGYRAKDINPKCEVDDIYLYCENRIVKNGLLKSVYNLNNEKEDIAEALNIKVDSINLAIDCLLNKKIEIIKNKGVNEAESIIKFTQIFLPQLLNNIEEKSKRFLISVEALIEEYGFLKFFKEKKTTKELMNYFNKKCNDQVFEQKLKNLKK